MTFKGGNSFRKYTKLVYLPIIMVFLVTYTKVSSNAEEQSTEATSSVEEQSTEATSSVEEQSTEATSSVEEQSTESSSGVEEQSTESSSSVEEYTQKKTRFDIMSRDDKDALSTFVEFYTHLGKNSNRKISLGTKIGDQAYINRNLEDNLRDFPGSALLGFYGAKSETGLVSVKEGGRLVSRVLDLSFEHSIRRLATIPAGVHFVLQGMGASSFYFTRLIPLWMEPDPTRVVLILSASEDGRPLTSEGVHYLDPAVAKKYIDAIEPRDMIDLHPKFKLNREIAGGVLKDPESYISERNVADINAASGYAEVTRKVEWKKKPDLNKIGLQTGKVSVSYTHRFLKPSVHTKNGSFEFPVDIQFDVKQGMKLKRNKIDHVLGEEPISDPRELVIADNDVSKLEIVNLPNLSVLGSGAYVVRATFKDLTVEKTIPVEVKMGNTLVIKGWGYDQVMGLSLIPQKAQTFKLIPSRVTDTADQDKIVHPDFMDKEYLNLFIVPRERDQLVLIDDNVPRGIRTPTKKSYELSLKGNDVLNDAYKKFVPSDNKIKPGDVIGIKHQQVIEYKKMIANYSTDRMAINDRFINSTIYYEVTRDGRFKELVVNQLNYQNDWLLKPFTKFDMAKFKETINLNSFNESLKVTGLNVAIVQDFGASNTIDVSQPAAYNGSESAHESIRYVSRLNVQKEEGKAYVEVPESIDFGAKKINGSVESLQMPKIDFILKVVNTTGDSESRKRVSVNVKFIPENDSKGITLVYVDQDKREHSLQSAYPIYKEQGSWKNNVILRQVQSGPGLALKFNEKTKVTDKLIGKLSYQVIVGP